MGSITTAFPSSYKAELPQAIHNHTTTSGDSFNAALITGSPAGNYGVATTNYSGLGADEASGTGYTAGGFTWTAAQNITPAVFGTESDWSWSANPSWAGITLSTSGCLFYNLSKAGRAVYVGSFGGIFNLTGGSFTILLPPQGLGTSVLALV